MKALLLFALASFPTGALAQPVLFDDFDGDTLAPNWGQVPSRWQYNVSNGMLNVTALTYPSSPKEDSNFALMGSTFPTQMDFRMDVWMGWDGGDLPEGIEFSPLTSGGSILATFGFRNSSTQGARIVMGAGTLFASSIPSPGPGMHHFTLTRSAEQFEFVLDGGPVATFPDTWRMEASVAFFAFTGPFPGQLGQLHIDRVQIVPAPAGVALLALSPLLFRRCRR